ncbi:MAG TPA: glycerol-3-phosphate dehydrogenase/oxidase, partial [Nocardioides sp.]|nr:glycerol-3-phosphate dehydrogenase/oxidase [Nocardioides sp.]
MNPAALSPRARTSALKKMATQHLDVLVVGGGVVGAGAALDAATRGLTVGLVEARDFASGTSSRSSKLVHGGLRYLEMLDFRLVAEALKERGLLMQRLAPHLVRPVPFLYPLKGRGWERWYAGSGVALYDAMSRASGYGDRTPLHRHLTRHGARKVFPSLRKDALVGAIRYYDAQVDDARHTMFLARTAATYGAAVASRVRVLGLLKESERVVGAEVIDLETGHRFEIRASQVINATGVWTDETQAMARERGQFRVRASKGIHLVVPRDRIRGETGLILRTETSVLFVIPWKRHWIIGTTDTDWALSKDHPAASSRDIDYLLEQVNRAIEVPLTRDDVEGVYAGLRPLLAGEDAATSKLSREHAVAHSVPGLVVVAGGKYTTYRVMAKDAVDEAVHGLDMRVAECVTEEIPLLGAEGYLALWNARARIAARTGLHVVRVEHLLNRYGSLTEELLGLIAEDPSLGEPLPAADDYLRAEIVYAASHEGARHLDDVLTRRTRI